MSTPQRGFSGAIFTETNNSFISQQIHYFPSDDAKERIVRPNSMWTAGCCIWTDQKTGELQAQSLAVMGNNEYDKTKIQMMSLKLEKLERLLTKTGNEPADLFPATPQCRANSISMED